MKKHRNIIFHLLEGSEGRHPIVAEMAAGVAGREVADVIGATHRGVEALLGRTTAVGVTRRSHGQTAETKRFSCLWYHVSSRS